MKFSGNSEQKINNENRGSNRAGFAVSQSAALKQSVCSACGAESHRRFAKYCLVCGKHLWEEYQPLDSLRASYRLQGREFQFEQAKEPEVENLFQKDENNAAELAWAFLVYSMVPYLGILFAPGALIAGSLGIVVAQRKPYLGGRKMAIYSIVLSVVVLAIQILLWWLLYIIPELGRQI